LIDAGFGDRVQSEISAITLVRSHINAKLEEVTSIKERPVFHSHCKLQCTLWDKYGLIAVLRCTIRMVCDCFHEEVCSWCAWRIAAHSKLRSKADFGPSNCRAIRNDINLLWLTPRVLLRGKGAHFVVSNGSCAVYFPKAIHLQLYKTAITGSRPII
jgi:hypothetical protein